MLELYHHGSSVCAAKVRFALAEKGVEVDEYHYVDILKGEQFAPEYVEINPKAVVPSLVHDGHVLNESTLICEYVDAAFDGPRLEPRDAYARYRMRLWTKAVDEAIHPACADITFVSCHRHVLKRLGEQRLEEFLEATVEQPGRRGWKHRKRELVNEGFHSPGIEDQFRLYDRCLFDMESALQGGEWLAGDTFSLADIGLAPYVNRLDMLGMAGLWQRGRLPAVERWFERLRARSTFEPAFLRWCPEPLTRDLAEYGAQSWPIVQRILGIGS